MIYDELRNFLAQASSSEVVAMFDSGIEVLDKYGCDNYLELFDATVGQREQNGDDYVIDSLTIDLRLLICGLVNNQGIFLSEEVGLADATLIANSLIDIYDYENKQELVDLLSTDEEPPEQISALLACISGKAVEHFLPLLESVEDFTVGDTKERLLSLFSEEPVALDILKYVEAYKITKALVKDLPLYADRYLPYPQAIGRVFADYVGDYKAHKADSLYDLSDENICSVSADFLSIAAISSDGFSTPLITIRKCLSSIYADLEHITKIDNKVGNYLARGA